MAHPSPETVVALVDSVRASGKYSTIAPQLIAHLVEIELEKRQRPKEVVKAVKNRLHQVVGAYTDVRPRYGEWLKLLGGAETPEALRVACRTIMEGHASSRERLGMLEEFYTTLLGDLPPIHSVIDVACGLNPLAIPFMPLMPDARYLAVDVMTDLMAFLGEAIRLVGMQSEVQVGDVTRAMPSHQADVALVIKAIPCLQQIDRTVGIGLIEALLARCVIVSYPVRSLGGNEKGMRAHYADAFNSLVDGKGWQVERFDFADELAFRIIKPTMIDPLPRV